MVAVSAACTTIVTFVFGTLSDRIGKRKPFIGNALPGHSLFAWSIPFMLLSIIPLFFLNRKHVQNQKKTLEIK